MQIVIAAKRRNGQWRAAHIVDGVFSDAAISDALSDVVAGGIADVLTTDYPNGTDVAINVTVSTPATVGTPATDA
jgi:hypothetical protein